MMSHNINALDLLRNARVEVAPETFYLLSLRHDDWLKLLENPELSPRMTAPFMIFRDKFEVTLLLDEVDYGTIRHATRDAKVHGGFRLLTFDVVMDFTVVGFIAEVSRILAEAGISIVAVSAFSRDHILVSQGDLGNALKALGPYVAELC
jgi:hypothetical protein